MPQEMKGPVTHFQLYKLNTVLTYAYIQCIFQEQVLNISSNVQLNKFVCQMLLPFLCERYEKAFVLMRK